MHLSVMLHYIIGTVLPKRPFPFELSVLSNLFSITDHRESISYHFPEAVCINQYFYSAIISLEYQRTQRLALDLLVRPLPFTSVMSPNSVEVLNVKRIETAS